MASEHIDPLVSFIGVVLQFASSALLATLFLLLRRYARRRPFFASWSIAWIVLTVGIGALAGTYILDGGISLETAAEPSPSRAAHGIYLCAKLAFIVLMVAGANRFAYGSARQPWLRLAVPVLAVYAVLALVRSADLAGVMRWEAPVAMAGFAWCSLRIGRLSTSRHGLGSNLAGSVFALMTLHWALFLFVAGAAPVAGIGELPPALRAAVGYGSFIEVLLHVLLGFGMVLLLMEQAKREVDDANAELAVAHSAMRRAALYDSLTGCMNRRAFDEGVGLENARRGFGAVMMFDLDDLKDVNDTHGHSAGDTLLRHLTDALRAELRPSDKLYRWGGDEFMMLLPGADEERARTRLRDVLNDAAVLHLGASETPVRLNVSMGSASYRNAEQLASAIETADAMMYQEKSRKKALRSHT